MTYNRCMPISDFTTIKESEYSYSDPIVVRKWATGSLSVKVGYVKKHPEKYVICLEKIWSGRGGQQSTTFNIKDGGDWEALKRAIDSLLPSLGDVSSKAVIDQAIDKISRETGFLEIIAKYPQLLDSAGDIDILLLPQDQKEALSKLLAVGGSLTKSVIEKLANQPARDIEEFIKLLETMKLSTINSLVTHVTSRLGFIEMFEKVIHDDSSFERRGAKSVHNLLKANIWMIDRNFSVLHDDETLKKIISERWGEICEDENATTRPDFLCMTNPFDKGRDRNLVIIEIKRPSVELKLPHVEQIMKYKEVLEKYSGNTVSSFTCYLVGREVSSLLKSNDLTKSGYFIKTYTDFIQDTRQFYEEYLKIIGSEELAF